MIFKHVSCNSFKEKIHKCLQYNSMKSDHLFAVIIFNKVYIMLVAKIKCITKPQTSWLNMLLRNFPACIVHLLRLFEATWAEHLWTDTAPHYYNGSSGFSEAVLQDWPEASKHLQTYTHKNLRYE